MDAFYLTKPDGSKPLNAKRLEALKADLIGVLERKPQGPEGRRITPVRASIRDVSVLGTDAETTLPVSKPRQSR